MKEKGERAYIERGRERLNNTRKGEKPRQSGRRNTRRGTDKYRHGNGKKEIYLSWVTFTNN